VLEVGKSYTWNTLGGISDLCHLTLGVTSNTYFNYKCCTFTVTSSLAYIILPTCALGLLVHPVPCSVTRKQIQHTFYVTLLSCVLRNQLNGLFILKILLTDDVCLQFLRKEVPRILVVNFM
jgi:hypothetical protein